jgi:PTS system galactitol-specific IIC component
MMKKALTILLILTAFSACSGKVEPELFSSVEITLSTPDGAAVKSMTVDPSLPGNKFLPLASLAGMFYLFPCVLPITKGNVPKTFVIGLVALIAGLFFVTNLTPAFTKAIAAANCDGITVPDGFEGGAALDFASALWCWSIYHLTVTLKWIGAALAGLLAVGMCAVNFVRIKRLK